MKDEKREIITNHVLKVILTHMDKSQAEFDALDKKDKTDILDCLEEDVLYYVGELTEYFKE